MNGAPLSEAIKAALAFLNNCTLSSMSVGLISFSDSVKVDSIAGQNVELIEQALKHMECWGANSAHPFSEIRQLLGMRKGSRYAIVLADGQWQNQEEAVRQARMCHELGIKIIGIGFGSADKEFLRRISSADQESIFIDMNALVETFSTIAQEFSERTIPSKGGHLNAFNC
jgi:molecular chaperone DnaK